MSLDVYLERDATEFKIASDLCEEHGFIGAAQHLRAHVHDVVFEGNITHNLGSMAGAAGVYNALWRPEEIGITHAHQLLEPLREGLRALLENPAKFVAMDPANGWGDYGGLVDFVTGYLEAATQYPQAIVRACR